MKRHGTAAWIVLFVLALQVIGFAQDGGHSGLGFGIRGGLGLDPNQGVIGAQFSLGKKFGISRLVPSVDVGFGDNVTTIDFNADFLFRLVLEDTNFGLYGGAGPTLAFIDSDNADGTWKFGVSAVVGTQLPIIPRRAFNIEARLGIGSIPDLRIMAAIIF